MISRNISIATVDQFVSRDSVDLTTVVSPTSSHNMGPIFQSSLDSLLPSLSEKESNNITNMPFNIEDLAKKIANKVAKKLGPQYEKKEKTSAIPFNPSAKLSLQSSNFIELLDKVPDFELLFEENSRVLQCSNCTEFVSIFYIYDIFRQISRNMLVMLLWVYIHTGHAWNEC